MGNSVIGFHLGPGGVKDGLGAWITNANSKGIPVGLKAVDEYGPLFEAVNVGNQYGVSNHLAFRFTVASGKVSREVPNYEDNPVTDAIALAFEVLAILPPEFDKSVFIELINEPRGKTNPGDKFYNDMAACDYLGEWCLSAATYLNSLGYRFCGPSFNSGEPGEQGQGTADAVKQYAQPGMLKYLAYCAANPDMAALSIHEYVWSEQPPQYPNLWGRYEAAIAAADLNGIPRTFSIFVTEYGFSLNNAPTMPQVTEWLYFYNQRAAYFPQVKMVASWTLQGGYSPVDQQVNTWMSYPIDKQFNEGEQPHKTNDIFGGTLPGTSPNLLLNANFEGTFYFQNGVPEFQVPDEWTLNVFSGPNPHNPSPFVPPEIRKVTPAGLPAGEWEMFGLSGQQAVKVFKGSGAWNASLYQFIDILPFPALMTIKGFADLVTGYKADGTKIYATYDPANPAGLWRVNGGAWYLTRPGEVNEVTFEVPAGTNLIEVEFMCPYPLSSSGFFLDNWKLLENETMPECNGLPREPYTRRYNVIPSDATEQQAVAIFLEGWRRTRETAGGSYDDAGIGDLPTKVVNLYGIADDQKQVFINWYNQHYPGTLISFLPIPGEESPFEFAVYPVKGRALQVNSHFNAPRSYGPHEGIDLFAQNSDEIVAVAPGIVDGIRTVDPGTGYGIYVRVKHNERFFTWYTHLKSVSVFVGQPVTTGQTLGLADSTGNSTGDHLHLTLVDLVEGLDGYVVPKVVDPLPYLQKFGTTPTYQYNGPAVTFSPALHGPASDYEWQNQELRNMLNTLNMPVKFMSNGINSDYYIQYKRPALDLVRVFWQPHTYKTPQQAWNDDIRDGVLRFYNLGARDFEVLNEPNLTSEGAGVVWDENNFGDWLRGLCLIIQSNCPGARLWFPGMSPGSPWSNQFVWTNKAWPKVKDLCAGFCLHAYTGITDNITNSIGDIVNQVKESQSYLNLQVPLIVSESSVNRAASAAYKAQVYKGVENQLKSVAGIKGVVWFVSSWEQASPADKANQESWLEFGIWQPYSN